MEDFSMTPPEGLWEAVEAKVQRPRAGFPWRWALAGVAAVAAAAVLILPFGNRTGLPGAPVSQVVESADSTLAAPADSVSVQPLQDVAPGGDDVLREEVSRPAKNPAAASVKALVADNSAIAPETDGAPSAEVRPSADSVPSADAVPSADSVPSADAVPSADSVPSADNTAAPHRNGRPDEEQKAPAVRDTAPESPSAQPENKPVSREPAGRVELVRQRGDHRVRLAFLGSGNPGGSTSGTVTEYGFSSGIRMSSSPVHTGNTSLPALLSRNKSTTTNTRHELSLRAGLMVSVPLSRRWSIESGLLLTALHTSIDSQTGTAESATEKDFYYVGIPLQAVYTPWRGKHFSCYLSAGPMVEWDFFSKWTSTSSIGGTNSSLSKNSEVPGDVVFSLGAAAGFQWHPYSTGAFFIQPGVSWHIPGVNVPENYYKNHPVAFTLSGGYRFIF